MIQGLRLALNRRVNPPLVGGSPPTPPTFILDTYSGATMAYSMRRLNTAYTGPLIRVRRFSDSVEMDIGYDSSNALDLTALTAFAGMADTLGISVWYDQSGSGKNATQVVGTSQPVIVIVGALQTAGGKPAVMWPLGNNVFFDLDASLYAQPNSFFLAHQFLDATSEDLFDGTANPNRNLLDILGGFYRLFAGTSAPTTSAPTTNFSQVAAIFSSTASRFSKNNTFLSPALNPGTNGISGMWLGKSVTTTYRGSISEFIFYNNSQLTNRAAISQNIIDYYGIT